MSEKLYHIVVREHGTGDILMEVDYTWHERSIFMVAWELSREPGVRMTIDGMDMTEWYL